MRFLHDRIFCVNGTFLIVNASIDVIFRMVKKTKNFVSGGNRPWKNASLFSHLRLADTELAATHSHREIEALILVFRFIKNLTPPLQKKPFCGLFIPKLKDEEKGFKMTLKTCTDCN